MNKKNLSINGLRGFASILVVLYHIYGMAYLSGFFERRDSVGFFKIIDNFGSIGVNLFFMISGYLIIGTLIRHKNIKKFLVDRFTRIFPLFLTLHLTIFIIGPIIHYSWLGGVNLRDYILLFVANAFLLPGLFDIPIAQKNAWTLSFEFTFYLMSAIFFLIYNKSNKFRIFNFYLAVLLSITLVSIHNTMIYFILGIAVYYFDSKSKIRSFKMYMLNFPILIILLYLYDEHNIFSIPSLLLFTILFFNIVKQKGILNEVLKSKVFQYLGNISYSLYLIHPFALFAVKLILMSIDLPMLTQNEYYNIFIFGIIGLIVSIIISNITFILIEQKLSRKLKDISGKTLKENKHKENIS